MKPEPPEPSGPHPPGEPPGPREAPEPAGPPPDEARRAFRRTLVRVMTVQVVTLLLLWLLQARFHLP